MAFSGTLVSKPRLFQLNVVAYMSKDFPRRLVSSPGSAFWNSQLKYIIDLGQHSTLNTLKSSVTLSTQCCGSQHIGLIHSTPTHGENGNLERIQNINKGGQRSISMLRCSHTIPLCACMPKELVRVKEKVFFWQY